ncbi:repressor LexA [Pullulanibacillus pueri]|uniref:LexA repressor n=1 Tax=Pullulanibacillus pueri TaxID=1437324 RepID=A0A8J2ZVB5_9BACL|nr:transcriptional repressor LexA [Pullulanibacillus pueri]MBM7682272.1 repressor LexA [Pullulanibacillus pueri]GGH80998.1 LexA repressor [Pullulanibacillus pueri]
MKLSKRQQAIIDFIKNEVKLKGYPPSVREIGNAVGLASTSTVHGHLERLEKKGYLRRDPTKPRAIEVIDPDTASLPKQESVLLPVIGKVTAGEPITAIENIDEYIPVPESLTGNNDAFILNVVGDSMINAGILNGDQVIVKSQHSADNGEIVVAMTEDDEATIKRFYKEKDHIRLQPENPTMDPIIVKNCTILGKIIGVFRVVH